MKIRRSQITLIKLLVVFSLLWSVNSYAHLDGVHAAETNDAGVLMAPQHRYKVSYASSTWYATPEAACENHYQNGYTYDSVNFVSGRWKCNQKYTANQVVYGFNFDLQTNEQHCNWNQVSPECSTGSEQQLPCSAVGSHTVRFSESQTIGEGFTADVCEMEGEEIICPVLETPFAQAQSCSFIVTDELLDADGCYQVTVSATGAGSLIDAGIDEDGRPYAHTLGNTFPDSIPSPCNYPFSDWNTGQTLPIDQLPENVFATYRPDLFEVIQELANDPDIQLLLSELSQGNDDIVEALLSLILANQENTSTYIDAFPTPEENAQAITDVLVEDTDDVAIQNRVDNELNSKVDMIDSESDGLLDTITNPETFAVDTNNLVVEFKRAFLGEHNSCQTTGPHINLLSNSFTGGMAEIIIDCEDTSQLRNYFGLFMKMLVVYSIFNMVTTLPKRG